MNLQIKTKVAKFQSAFEKAKEILDNPAFWEAIESHPHFDFTNLSAKEIAKILKETNHAITIVDWKPSVLDLRFKDTTALVEDKETILLNVRKDWRTVEQVAGTMIHEGVHAVDKAHPDLKFGHKGNKRRGNENTSPYWIGDLVVNLLSATYELGKPFKLFLEE